MSSLSFLSPSVAELSGKAKILIMRDRQSDDGGGWQIYRQLLAQAGPAMLNETCLPGWRLAVQLPCCQSMVPGTMVRKLGAERLLRGQPTLPRESHFWSGSVGVKMATAAKIHRGVVASCALPAERATRRGWSAGQTVDGLRLKAEFMLFRGRAHVPKT